MHCHLRPPMSSVVMVFNREAHDAANFSKIEQCMAVLYMINKFSWPVFFFALRFCPDLQFSEFGGLKYISAQHTRRSPCLFLIPDLLLRF